MNDARQQRCPSMYGIGGTTAAARAYQLCCFRVVVWPDDTAADDVVTGLHIAMVTVLVRVHSRVQSHACVSRNGGRYISRCRGALIAAAMTPLTLSLPTSKQLHSVAR
jgi:hypothetical protein